MLLKLLAQLREVGVTIAFDPNYRSTMWQDIEHAKFWLSNAYQHSDIVLPGLQEHNILWGHKNHQLVADYFSRVNVTELVIKCDEQGVYGYQQNMLVAHQPFKAAPVQVDSTAAGDSFAGTFLAARLDEKSIQHSIADACEMASIVVQHKGAILTDEVYRTALNHH